MLEIPDKVAVEVGGEAEEILFTICGSAALVVITALPNFCPAGPAETVRGVTEAPAILEVQGIREAQLQY